MLQIRVSQAAIKKIARQLQEIESLTDEQMADLLEKHTRQAAIKAIWSVGERKGSWKKYKTKMYSQDTPGKELTTQQLEAYDTGKTTAQHLRKRGEAFTRKARSGRVFDVSTGGKRKKRKKPLRIIHPRESGHSGADPAYTREILENIQYAQRRGATDGKAPYSWTMNRRGKATNPWLKRSIQHDVKDGVGRIYVTPDPQFDNGESPQWLRKMEETGGVQTRHVRRLAGYTFYSKERKSYIQLTYRKIWAVQNITEAHPPRYFLRRARNQSVQEFRKELLNIHKVWKPAGKED